jgi:hypothetical protein
MGRGFGGDKMLSACETGVIGGDGISWGQSREFKAGEKRGEKSVVTNQQKRLID